MQLISDVLRSVLAKSLSPWQPLDRLAAAWPVVAGSMLASRAPVADYQDSTVTLQVNDEAWRREVEVLAGTLQRDLAKVSGVPLTHILVRVTTRQNVAAGRPTTP